MKSDQLEPGSILVLPRIKGITLLVTENGRNKGFLGGNWKRNIMD